MTLTWRNAYSSLKWHISVLFVKLLKLFVFISHKIKWSKQLERMLIFIVHNFIPGEPSCTEGIPRNSVFKQREWMQWRDGSVGSSMACVAEYWCREHFSSLGINRGFIYPITAFPHCPYSDFPCSFSAHPDKVCGSLLTEKFSSIFMKMYYDERNESIKVTYMYMYKRN